MNFEFFLTKTAFQQYLGQLSLLQSGFFRVDDFNFRVRRICPSGRNRLGKSQFFSCGRRTRTGKQKIKIKKQTLTLIPAAAAAAGTVTLAEARRRRPRGRRRRIHRPLPSPTPDPPPVRSHRQRGGEGRGGEREERSRGPVVAACTLRLHRRPHASPALRWICKGRKEEGSRGGGAGPRAATAAPMLPSAGAGCKGRVGSRGEGRGHVPRRPPSLPAPAAWMQVEGGEGRGRMPHVPSATAPCTRAAGRLRL